MIQIRQIDGCTEIYIGGDSTLPSNWITQVAPKDTPTFFKSKFLTSRECVADFMEVTDEEKIAIEARKYPDFENLLRRIRLLENTTPAPTRRNVILNSDTAFYKGSQYSVGKLRFSEDISEWEAGADYTTSFDIEYQDYTPGTNGFIGMQATVVDHGSWEGYISCWRSEEDAADMSENPTGRKRIVMHGTMPALGSGTKVEATRIAVYIPQNTGGFVRVSNFMLEKGNVENPVWLPAPEDIRI